MSISSVGEAPDTRAGRVMEFSDAPTITDRVNWMDDRRADNREPHRADVDEVELVDDINAEEDYLLLLLAASATPNGRNPSTPQKSPFKRLAERY
ncbi:hypothetical protein [Cryobacterium sp. M91]|uniref:hypothetical protein n=1 Tax=Cryobacterium sp. M91 TaxID=2048294 RepID=UPI000CE34C48|nr:hypothetical protein [Cryobacterium sp. M91]